VAILCNMAEEIYPHMINLLPHAKETIADILDRRQTWVGVGLFVGTMVGMQIIIRGMPLVCRV
jgi:hypothetical protein